MIMPRKPTGGLKYWQRYANEHGFGVPDSVEQETPWGYRIRWGDYSVYTPFVGGPRKLKKLVAELQAWSKQDVA